MNIDIPLAPQEISSSQVQISFHIRLLVREAECSDFPFLAAREIHEKKFERLTHAFVAKLSSIPSPVW